MRALTNFKNKTNILRKSKLGSRPIIFVIFASALILFAALSPVNFRSVAALTSITTSWSVKQFTLDDGRIYYASVPSCAPATDQACIDFMATPRTLIQYAHAADYAEDPATAAANLNNLHAISGNTIFTYPVSANGTKRWDGGNCCTLQPVDDVGYLVKITQQVSANYAVNANRVGLMGYSNGGILTERAVCERYDIFKAGASFAGTFAGDCRAAKVKLAQWHGSDDTVVPLDGGTTTITGVNYTFPSAASLGKRMQAGSTFTLTVMSGIGHTNAPFSMFVSQINWLNSQFAG